MWVGKPSKFFNQIHENNEWRWHQKLALQTYGKNFIKNFYASIEILLSLRNEKRDGFQMYSLFLLCYDHCHRIFVASLTNLFVFIFSGFRRTDQQRAAKRPCQRKVQKICGKIRSQEVTHGESSALPSRFSFS